MTIGVGIVVLEPIASAQTFTALVSGKHPLEGPERPIPRPAMDENMDKGGER